MNLLSLLSLVDVKLPQTPASETLPVAATMPDGSASPFAGLLARIGADAVDPRALRLPLPTTPAQTPSTRAAWLAADVPAPEVDDGPADGAELPLPAIETGDSLPDQPPIAVALPMPTTPAVEPDGDDDGAVPVPSVAAAVEVASPIPMPSDAPDTESSSAPRPAVPAMPSDPHVPVVRPMVDDRDGVVARVANAAAAPSSDEAVSVAGSAGAGLDARESKPNAGGRPGFVAAAHEQQQPVERSPMHRAPTAAAISPAAATDATTTTDELRSMNADVVPSAERRERANDAPVDPLLRRPAHLWPSVNPAPSKVVEAAAPAYPVNDPRTPAPIGDAIRERSTVAQPVPPEPAPALAGAPITTTAPPSGLPPQHQIRHPASTTARTSERELRLDLRSIDGQRSASDDIDASRTLMPGSGRPPVEMPVDARLFTAAATPDTSRDTASEPALPKADAALARPADAASPQARPQPQPLQFVPNQLIRFSAELTDRVIQLRAHSLDRATIALDPADLGRVEIRLRMDAETTHVGFVAHNAAVRDAIEAQLPRLRALLESSGLTLGDVDVDQSGTPGDGGRSPSEEAPRRTSRRRIDAVAAEDMRPSTSEGRRGDGALIDVHA